MTSSAPSEEFYRVKEDLVLKNLLERSRSDKARVLRLQQVKNFHEWYHEGSDNTVIPLKKQSNIDRHVHFAPGSLIQVAIKEGKKYEVLDCLSSGVPVNFKDVHGEGMPLLHQACVYDDYIIAEALIKKGASVDSQDDYHCTPLHICCLWDSIKCAQLLMANNASTNVLDVDGNFAVDLAPENSHLRSMMKKHMQQKLKLDNDKLQSLRNKAQRAMVQDIRQILEEGKSVDTPSTSGISLLHIAVTNGYMTAARMLLENSANVNAADMQLWTPLHCAAKYHQAKMVRLLLSHYANPHARTSKNFTPRELAKNQEIMNTLLQAEDSFLDLDKQKTPVKPKRFSASLLDQCEVEEEISLVRTRVISSTKIAKRDIVKEKELIEHLKEELKQELKSEMYFTPPGTNASMSSIPGWQQLAPPPVPPRDEPPQIHFSLDTLQKKKGPKTNQLHDEKLLKAVITIQQEAHDSLVSKGEISSLSDALQTIEVYGNSFFDQIVMQNAEDIARENDRQRTLKSHYRNSWCAERRPSARSVQGRPLSTGTISMAHSSDHDAVWVSQSTVQNPYDQASSNVVPHCSENIGYQYWNTLSSQDSRVGGQANSMKIGDSSIHSSVSNVSKHKKDAIELTGTVKRSLKISSNTSHPSTYIHKQHAPAVNPIQSVYRMPPLTPTVATLLHTANVTESQALPAVKTIKPITSTLTSTENLHYNTTLPNNYPSIKSLHRDRKYGTLLSNRSNILRDARLKDMSNSSASAATNRHSWNYDEGCAANTGSSPVESSRKFNSPPLAFDSSFFSDSIQCSLERIPSTYSISSSPGRDSYLGLSGTPPSLPPRDSSSQPRFTGNVKTSPESNKGPFSTFNPLLEKQTRNDHQANLFLPLKVENEANIELSSNSSAEDDLPTIPPPLALYTPKVPCSKPELDEMGFPAPPPPDVLLYDTLKIMGLRNNKPRNPEYVDFPPPPPPHLL